MAASWPDTKVEWDDPTAEAEMKTLMEIITRVRNIRAEMNLDPAKRVPLVIAAQEEATRLLVEKHADLLQTIARLESLEV